MTADYLPPTEFLRECFLYDPENGTFFWKHRPERHFGKPHIARVWNLQFAGRPAFVGRDKDGYARCEVRYGGRRVRVRASKVAYKLMTGEEHELLDHRNRVRTDNRFENLRPARPIDNSRNCEGKPDRLLPKGVFFEQGKFAASLSLHQRKVRLGRFATPSEAHAAYCAAASKLFGEFFNPGPPKFTIWD